MAEVDEVAGLVEALIVGGGDYAQAETAARQFYDLVLQDFGPETRQAVQIEFVMVLAAAAQDQQDRAQALGLQLMEKAERVLRREPWSLRAQKNLRATRLRLARRDAGRTGHAVVDTQPPLATSLGELMPFDLAVPLALLAQLAAIGLWWSRRRTHGELARVGMAAAMVISLGVAGGAVAVIAARRGIPPTGVVLRDGLRLKQSPRADAIPDAALREGERVDVVARDGEFVRVRTIAGRMGWLPGRDLGRLGE